VLYFIKSTPFATVDHKLGQLLTEAPAVDVGSVHAQNTKGMPALVTRELENVSLQIDVPLFAGQWASVVNPNLPWAEDHFAERVSGEPLNPSPSEAWWPFAEAGNSMHKADEKYSHTYPERFWPKSAGEAPAFTDDGAVPLLGIRYYYGDLDDVVDSLITQPETRQAYLPVFFPEDTGQSVRDGVRVPCSLGYHFMYRNNQLNCNYYMRSCDFVRYFRDDVYMAGRLMQWVWEKCIDDWPLGSKPGTLTVHISSLHVFEGDIESMRGRYGVAT
jgi:hypothetical protein